MQAWWYAWVAQKSELIAISYSAVVKQVFKLAHSNAECNRRLFALGEDIGLRVADEIQDRETNSYKPEEVAASFLKAAMRDYMGCEVAILAPETTYQKGRFSVRFRVAVRDNPLSDFIVLGRGQAREGEQGENLNYHAILLGFASGCLKTMAYHPTVTLLADSLFAEAELSASAILAAKAETQFAVEMWKEKEED